MSNWALLQEQLTGKPVVKRAIHGIHFDNGDGQILANFSGKPCHWQATGLKVQVPQYTVDVTLKWIDDAGVAHTRSETYPKAVIRYGSYSRRNT